MTDHWSPATDCAVTDMNGTDLYANPPADFPGFPNPLIGPNCLEVPITGVETKDGAFDGGYAFADYCPEAR